MILYNVTFGIDKGIEAEWIQWMKETHIPEVMETGVFSAHKLYKVISHEDQDTASYCVQFFTPSIIQFNQYLETYAPIFMERHLQRYKDRHVAFNTLLEEVSDF